MGSKIFIRFTSPEITDFRQYKVFAGTFSQFGNINKLYLDYHEKYGKVYFDLKIDAQKAYNCLKKSNSLSMILDPPAEEFIKKKMYEDIEVEEENLYDLYGNVITIFKANDGEKYVPFNSLCASGYKLFTENITAKYRKANQVDLENLESFLNLQLQTYLVLHKISLDSVDVPCLMEKCTSVFKRLESTNTKPIIKRTAPGPSDVVSPKSKESIQRTVYNATASKSKVDDNTHGPSDVASPKSKESIQRTVYNATASKSKVDDNGGRATTYELNGNAEKHNIEKKNQTRSYTQTSDCTNSDFQTNKPNNNNYKSPIGKEERTSQSNVTNFSNSLQNNKTNKSTETLQNNSSKFDTTNEPAVVSEPSTSNNCLRKPVNIKQPNINRKSIAETSKCNGYLQCRSVINKNLLLVSTVPTEYYDDIVLLEQIKVDYDPKYKPLVGTTVAIDWEDTDDELKIVRAVIVSENNNEYTCGIIDYGILEKTKKVYRLADEFKDIVEFSMICKTEDDLMDKVEVGALYEFSSTENKIKLSIDEKIYNAVGIKWNPLESHDASKHSKKVQKTVVTTLPLDEIKEDERVMIVSEHNGFLGIRSKVGHILLKTLSEQLHNYGEKLQALEKSPVLNQLVLVQTPNDIQRAVVKELNSDTSSVLLIDTGSYITVPITKLYYIDSFAEIRGTLHICKLKDYETKIFKPIVKDYLASMISKKGKFTMVSLRNGVIDLLDNKQSLSEKLSALEQPVYKTQRDLPPQTLPIGETTELFLAGDYEIEKSILAFYIPKNSEKLDKLLTELEACDDKPIPLNLHVDELCVAKFEGSWSRASVLEVDAAKNEYLVYYFDFGNSSRVSGDDVRELPEHLTKLEPLAIRCRFQDILEKYKCPLPTNIMNKIQSSMPSYEHYEVRILSKDGDVYNGLSSILTDNVL